MEAIPVSHEPREQVRLSMAFYDLGTLKGHFCCLHQACIASGSFPHLSSLINGKTCGRFLPSSESFDAMSKKVCRRGEELPVSELRGEFISASCWKILPLSRVNPSWFCFSISFMTTNTSQKSTT